MSWGAGKRDNAEDAICGALLKAGCTLEYAHRKPYDLIVGVAGRTYLLEVKSPTGTLTESQEAFIKSWYGHYAVVRSAKEALKTVGLLK